MSSRIISQKELYPIVPLNIYGKPWEWGRTSPNSKNLLICLTRAIALNKFASLEILIILIQLPYTSFICGCSHCCWIIFVSTSSFMYTCVMLILINWCVMKVAFSMTKASKGQSSPEQTFYSLHLSVLSEKPVSLYACLSLFCTPFFISNFIKF